jgi:Flp pilus assembly protein TadG
MEYLRVGMSARRRGHGPEQGQTMVEFALVAATLLLLLIVGSQLVILQLRVTDAGHIASQAAVEAARYGGESPELKTSIQHMVKNSFLDPDRVYWRVETRAPDGGTLCKEHCQCQNGQQVAVVVTFKYELQFFWQASGEHTSEAMSLCWRGLIPNGS